MNACGLLSRPSSARLTLGPCQVLRRLLSPTRGRLCPLSRRLRNHARRRRTRSLVRLRTTTPAPLSWARKHRRRPRAPWCGCPCQPCTRNCVARARRRLWWALGRLRTCSGWSGREERGCRARRRGRHVARDRREPPPAASAPVELPLRRREAAWAVQRPWLVARARFLVGPLRPWTVLRRWPRRWLVLPGATGRLSPPPSADVGGRTTRRSGPSGPPRRTRGRRRARQRSRRSALRAARWRHRLGRYRPASAAVARTAAMRHRCLAFCGESRSRCSGCPGSRTGNSVGWAAAWCWSTGSPSTVSR